LTKGLVQAVPKFDEYKFAKYNRAKTVKLRDVFRITRPKLKDDAQSLLWKRAVNDELAVPDTWEVAISACSGDNEKKKQEFTRLLIEKTKDEETGKEFNKLGDLAFLRNIRKLTRIQTCWLLLM
jgi:hypothetical protein